MLKLLCDNKGLYLEGWGVGGCMCCSESPNFPARDIIAAIQSTIRSPELGWNGRRELLTLWPGACLGGLLLRLTWGAF